MADKVQLIKEEIERLKSQAHTIPNLGINALAGFQLACDDVIAFINSLPKEHNEDLEEEILCRWEDDSHTLWSKYPYSDFKNIAYHFAEWQKQRMMKDAINGIMDCDDDNEWIEITDKLIVTPSKAGKKVKFIVVKEE